MLDDILQFPDVPGPLVLLKPTPIVVRRARLLTSFSKSCARGFARGPRR
jgi:hypothetical protein